MRVIKHGDSFEIGQITCKKCHCEFAYNRKDIRQETYTDYESYDHEEITKNIIMCPECHATIEV